MASSLHRKFHLFALGYSLVGVGALICHFLLVNISEESAFGISVETKRSLGSILFPSRIRGVKIHLPGITLPLLTTRPFFVTTEGGTQHRSSLNKVLRRDSDWEISFTNNIVLKVSPSQGDDSFLLTLAIPKVGRPPLVSLSLPIAMKEGFSLREGPQKDILYVTDGETRHYILTLPMGSTVDLHHYRLHIPSTASHARISLRSSKSLNGSFWEAWDSERYPTLSDAELKEAAGHFVEFAYQSWQKRYDLSRGQWRDTSASLSPSKEQEIFVLAEALQRGHFRLWVSSLQKKQPLSLTLAPFLGNIVKSGRSLILKRDRFLTKSLAALSEGELPFTDRLPLLFTERNLLREVQEKIAHLPPPAPLSHSRNLLSLEILSGGVYGLPYFDKEVIDSFVSKVLTHYVFSLPRGLFLSDSSLEIPNLRLTLKVGALLLRLASPREPRYEEIGRALLASSLAQLNEVKSLVGEASSAGIPLPEELYPFLADNPYLPKMIPLDDTLGRGGWIWSVADQFHISKVAGELRLSFRFPRGESHYFLAQGIEPFVRLSMHDLPLDGLSAFEEQPSGWFYDLPTKTLFVKIFHRTPRETVRLSYRQAPSPLPSLPAPAPSQEQKPSPTPSFS